MKQKRLTVKVDPHTFGGSRASESLARVLNEQHPELVTKVGGVYHKFTEHLTSCEQAAAYFPNGGLRTMLEMYKQHKFATVRKSTLPDIVKSLLLNVMSTAFKLSLYEINLRMSAAAITRNLKRK